MYYHTKIKLDLTEKRAYNRCMDQQLVTQQEYDADEAAYEAFHRVHTTVATTGEPPLDALLVEGLYGKKMPKVLKGQKAADAFQSAFDLIGGVPRLALWADKNPTAFFSLYSKLIPSSIQAQVDTTIRIEAPWMNANRLNYTEEGTDATV